MVTLKLSNANYKAAMEALKKCAYNTALSYNDRLPFLQAYQDIDYKLKLEQRKAEKAKRRKEKQI